MKKTIVFLAFLFLVIAIAFFTNPTPSEHKAAVKEVLNEHLKKSINSNFPDLSEDQNAASDMGMMLGGALVEMLVENMVASEDYFLFSVTQITWNNNTRTVGIGLFGHVMISDELEEHLNTISKGEEKAISEYDEEPKALQEDTPFEEEEDIDPNVERTLSQEEADELVLDLERQGWDYDPDIYSKTVDEVLDEREREYISDLVDESDSIYERD